MDDLRNTLAAQIAAMEARAKREREVYGQTELPDMLMAGVEAMKRVGMLEARSERYCRERNEALGLNAARAQQLASAWVATDEARQRAEAAEARLAAYEEKKE